MRFYIYDGADLYQKYPAVFMKVPNLTAEQKVQILTELTKMYNCLVNRVDTRDFSVELYAVTKMMMEHDVIPVKLYHLDVFKEGVSVPNKQSMPNFLIELLTSEQWEHYMWGICTPYKEIKQKWFMCKNHSSWKGEPYFDMPQNICIGTSVRLNIDVLRERDTDPASLLHWFIECGDHNEVFTVRHIYNHQFPEYPYILDRFLCECSFSQDELIPAFGKQPKKPNNMPPALDSNIIV